MEDGRDHMESSKVGPNGSSAGGKEGESAGEKRAAKMRHSVIVLRVFILAASLTATLIMATAKQSKIIQIQVVSTLPPLSVPYSAKSTYSSAFIYFIVANSIAFVYTAISTMASLLMAKRSSAKGIQVMMVVSIMDLVMVALLFSGAGAAITFGLLGQNGNSHVGWEKVCPVFSKFCTHVRAAIAVSMVATLNYFLVLLISIIDLHKRSTSFFT